MQTSVYRKREWNFIFQLELYISPGNFQFPWPRSRSPRLIRTLRRLSKKTAQREGRSAGQHELQQQGTSMTEQKAGQQDDNHSSTKALLNGGDTTKNALSKTALTAAKRSSSSKMLPEEGGQAREPLSKTKLAPALMRPRKNMPQQDETPTRQHSRNRTALKGEVSVRQQSLQQQGTPQGVRMGDLASNRLRDVCSLAVISAFRTYRKCTKRTKRLVSVKTIGNDRLGNNVNG
jgi:hypothetical protein